MRLTNNAYHGGSDSDLEQARYGFELNLPRLIDRVKMYANFFQSVTFLSKNWMRGLLA